MRTISIKELHERTGHWVRRVTEEEELLITERGRPVARVLPPPASPIGNPFANRKVLPGVAELVDRVIGGPDSAEIISAMREGR